jgi:hypothetical protein
VNFDFFMATGLLGPEYRRILYFWMVQITGRRSLCTGTGLWRFLAPKVGWSLRSISTGRWWQFDGSAWAEELRATDLGTSLSDYADDTAAATGGVAVGGLYHTSGTVKVRLI